jgi:hypothetical protein
VHEPEVDDEVGNAADMAVLFVRDPLVVRRPKQMKQSGGHFAVVAAEVVKLEACEVEQSALR